MRRTTLFLSTPPPPAPEPDDEQHRFDPDYQAAINAQKQAEADVQMLQEQQKNLEVQKKSELEGKRAAWNKQREEATGAAGRVSLSIEAHSSDRSTS